MCNVAVHYAYSVVGANLTKNLKFIGTFWWIFILS